MKQILLFLLLSLSLMSSTHANAITDLFFPKLEKFNECIESLKKQNIGNREMLCVQKYGKEIDKSMIDEGKHGANNTGNFTFKMDNNSIDRTIKAVNIKGYFKCKDESNCIKQYFDVTEYTSISPGEKKEIYFSEDYDDYEINLPDGIVSGAWSWNITSREFIGFKVDY